MKKVKTNKLGRRILSFVLTVALMVGLMPGNVMTVRAEDHIDDNGDGICDHCDSYAEPKQEDEYYQIANANNLMWFAQQVNEGQTAINAKLTADIDMNGIDWTIMSSFAGTFDGNGYTISGLNGHKADTGDTHGFIRTLADGGVVKNLTFTEADIWNHEGSGAISAVIVYTNNGTVENCVVKSSLIQHGNYDALGVVVGVNGGTIRSCASISNTMTRRFSSAKDICGFVWSNSGSIENCFNYDCTYQNGSNRYAFTGINNGTITNCYYYESSETILDTVATEKKADQFASGEVAYLLNGDQTTIVWGQTLTGENAQAYPVLNGDKVYRYESVKCDSSSKDPAVYGYSNEEKSDVIDEHNVDSNGFCTVCGAYEQPETDEKGVYQISNAGELYWFADKVNNDNANYGSANAKLTADIVVNSDENISSYNGTDSVSWRPWTPIGNNSNIYTGTFDGNNKTVSGLYFNNTSQNYVGLFGYLKDGEIKNVGVVNSYFNGNNYVGGVCGRKYGTITNCYNTGTVVGAWYVGGVCGYNSGGTIKNCYNTGCVSGTIDYVGGVCSYNSGGTIENCYNTGCVSGTYSCVGGVCGYNYVGPITNCYYDNTVYTGNAVSSNYNGTLTSVEGKSTDQFESGEVTYLLNGSSSENVTWYQKLLTDTYPVLDIDIEHGIVYSVFKCDGEEQVYRNVNENEPHTDEDSNNKCDECGSFVDGIGAELAGYTLSLNGNIGVNFYMELDTEVAADENAYMLFTLPNGDTKQIAVAEATQNTTLVEDKTYYVFSCEVASYEMAQSIKAQMFDGKGNGGKEYSYTVRDYAEYIINNEANYTSDDVAFAKAMLNYGACSQTYFDVETDNLANKNLDVADQTVATLTASDLEAYKVSATSNELGTFAGYSLTLKSETTLKAYFKPAEGVDVSNLTFTANGQTVTPAKSGDYYVLSLENIKAWDLDRSYTFKVSNNSTELEFSCSALSYGYSVLNKGNSTYPDTLIQLISALRVYQQKSEVYVSGNN